MSQKEAYWLMERNMKARSLISKIGMVFNSQSANLPQILIHKALMEAFHSRKFEFKVFSNVHLNDHNF